MSTVSSTASLLTSSTTSSTSTAAASSATSSTSSSSSSSSTSDIDWDALIEEAVNARLAKADSIDVKVSDNELTIAAYEEVSSLLSTMQDAADALRAPSGSSSSSTDAFQARSAYLTAVGDVDAASTLSATVDAGSETGSYKLEVLQLAQAHKVMGTATTTNATDLEYSGVISLGVDGGEAVEVTIDADMALIDIAEAINNVSDTSGVQASVVKVSDTDYRLVLSSVDTGQTITASEVSGDTVLQSLGLLDSEGSFANEIQQATQAIIEIDDIQITRSTNEIDDVLDGVTLYLYQTTATDTSITLEIGEDVSAVKDAIVALADAYNAYREYALTQQTLPSESSDSVLFGDGTLRNLNISIGNALATTIDSASLSLLGLSFDESNYLVLDETTLDDILLTDLDAVESLLTFQMESSNSDLLLLTRGSTIPDDFVLDIEVDEDGEIVSASINGDSSLFTVDGTRITGADGTDFEDFTFVYAGDKTTSVSISMSGGIAETLYNIANGATDETDGTLTTLISDLETYNEELTEKSDDIRSRAEDYRETLTARYAEYQAAIATAESSLDYLETLLDTWNAS